MRWPGTWTDHAICKGHLDLFFPEQNQHQSSTPRALAFCNRCPVVDQCRDFALHNGERFGIWGAMTVGQLRSERNRLGIELQPLPNPTH